MMIQLFDEAGLLPSGVVHDIEERVFPVLLKILLDHDKELDYANIVLMTDDELLEINRQYLNHDYYTDIITFNYAEEAQPLEGELYISVDRVKEYASANSVDYISELNRVMIHGFLHLAGYDDNTEIAKNRMQSLENQYISLIVPRETMDNDGNVSQI